MAERGRAWAVIVHGGAKTIDTALFERNRAGCLAAVHAGVEVLRHGGGAVPAAEAAVRSLEDDPVVNAGYGSVLNADGAVEMDAAMMDGASLAVGGVAGVRRLRNPIMAARLMLPEVPVLLAGEGAERFARSKGLALCEPAEMISPERLASEHSRGHDTVGCVVLDGDGHVAAATSTGGLPGKHPGRIGDSPIPGCGLYADDLLGGVALSGDGECIIRTALAAHAMRLLESAPPRHAAAGAMVRLARVGGEAGVIVLDREGRFGVAHNSDHFAVACWSSAMPEPRAAIHRDEIEETLSG